MRPTACPITGAEGVAAAVSSSPCHTGVWGRSAAKAGRVCSETSITLLMRGLQPWVGACLLLSSTRNARCFRNHRRARSKWVLVASRLGYVLLHSDHVQACFRLAQLA